MTMNVYHDLLNGKSKLALVGLGYVGMPIAVAFAKKVPVIGFDLNRKKSSATGKVMIPPERWAMRRSVTQQWISPRMRPV